jgi:hypothetical protein
MIETTPHALHVGSVLDKLGDDIETACMFNGERAHFALIVWTDNMVQCVSNTMKEDYAEVLRAHADMVEKKLVEEGPAT